MEENKEDNDNYEEKENDRNDHPPLGDMLYMFFLISGLGFIVTILIKTGAFDSL